jgi:hypothetical protein
MTKYLKLNNEKVKAFYDKSLTAFRKQFKDVVKINKLYVNDENKVYSAEWIDSNGVINFNGGYAPDVAKEIIFEDK